jgi:predicted nucleic acid-binding protein
MIIDANIALKWVLPEPESAAALALAVRPDLAVPSHFYLEVAHVLTKLARRGVVTRVAARANIAVIRTAPLRVEDSLALLDSALDLALRLNLTSADCLYLALAVKDGDVLVTNDLALRRASERDASLAGRVRLLEEV